jgi:hypothetical protein
MDENTTTVRASAKQLGWFGAKISIMVLGPICILLWLVMIGLVFYKSVSIGISPIEFLNSAVPDKPGSPTFLEMLLRTKLLVLGALSTACAYAH